MSKTMYRIDCFRHIEKREILRETAKTVIFEEESWGEIRERKELKRSDYHSWHNTWEEAKNFLVSKARSKLEYAKRDLDRARSNLQKIERLKEPSEETA